MIEREVMAFTEALLHSLVKCHTGGETDSFALRSNSRALNSAHRQVSPRSTAILASHFPCQASPGERNKSFHPVRPANRDAPFRLGSEHSHRITRCGHESGNGPTRAAA